jgi:hypothetical protein
MRILQYFKCKPNNVHDTLTVTLFEASRTQNEFYIDCTQNEFYIEFHTIKLTTAWEEKTVLTYDVCVCVSALVVLIHQEARRAGLDLSREAIKRNKKRIPPIASLDETNPALV